MRKLVVSGLSIVATLFVVGNAFAGGRPVFVPQGHSGPVIQHFAPQYHYPHVGVPPHLNNYAAPGGHSQQQYGGVGRHGLPMVHGVRGWHETHNRTRFSTLLPGNLFGSAFEDQDVDVETFIDGIDVSSPLEPTTGCSVAPCVWAAMSAAPNGATQAVGGQPTPEAARAITYQGCLQVSQGMDCSASMYASGTAWIAAVYCDRSDGLTGTVMGSGDDLGAAIRNSYRTAFQQFGFDPGDCTWWNAVEADGSAPAAAQTE